MVQQTVETRFVATDSVTGTLASIADRASRTAIAITGVNAALNIMGRVAAAASSPLRSIIRVGEEYEVLRNTIAGTFQAFDMVGMSAAEMNERFHGNVQAMTRATIQGFHEAQTAAESVISLIERRAAELPGTAEQYTEVFNAALPGMGQSHFRNASEAAEFTSRSMAFGASRGISSRFVGTGLYRMLQGFGTVQNPFVRAMLPLMQNRQGRQLSTIAELNRMSGVDRSRTIETALNRYSGLFAEMENTWEAQFGTFQSILKITWRDATRELFGSMKDNLKWINSYLQQMQPYLIALGTIASRGIGSVFERVRYRLDEILSHYREIARSITESTAFRVVAGTMRVVSREARSAVDQGASFGGFSMLSGHPIVGALYEFAKHTDAVNDTLLGLYGTVTVVARAIGQLYTAASGVAVRLGNVLAVYVPLVSRMIYNIAYAIAPYFESALDVAGTMAAFIADGLISMAHPLAQVVEELWSFVAVIPAATSGLSTFWNETFDESPLQSASNAVGMFGEAVAWLTGYRLQQEAQQIGESYQMSQQSVVNLQHTLATGAAEVVSTLVFGLGAPIIRVFDLFGVRLGGLSDVVNNTTKAIENAINEFFSSHRRLTESAPDQRPGADNSVEDFRTTLENTVGEMRARMAMALQDRTHLGGRPPPNQRGGHNTHIDNRYGRWTIEQQFAEGFDPDRIAVTTMRDLERMADTRLDSGFDPAYSMM